MAHSIGMKLPLAVQLYIGRRPAIFRFTVQRNYLSQSLQAQIEITSPPNMFVINL